MEVLPSWHEQLNVRILDLQEYLVLREDHQPAIDLSGWVKWVYKHNDTGVGVAVPWISNTYIVGYPNEVQKGREGLLQLAVE